MKRNGREVKVSVLVALLRKRYKGGNGIKDFGDYAFGDIGAVVGDILADFMEVNVSLGVKLVLPHALRRRASMLSISCA